MIGITATAEEEKHDGIWYPEPVLAITSAYVDYRVDSNTCTLGNPIPELTLKVPKHENFSLTFFALRKLIGVGDGN
jgi:hypothetical protein